MKTIAIITARGGSKRIPKKNIKEFMGKPMLAYAIQAAIDSKIFDEVMVSTDDAQIVEIAKKYGAKVPFMRSEKTANDFASTYAVLEEVVLEYKEQGISFDNLCCIYPCVPFLTPERLKQAYEKFTKSKANALIPVVKFSFPIQRAFKINSSNYLEHREAENARKRSQDLEAMYHDVGMFYFANIEEMLKQKRLSMLKSTYIILNEAECQDIDTMQDWELAEMKYKILKGIL